MIALPKQKRVSTQKAKPSGAEPKKNVEVSEPIPIPQVVIPEKPPSYRQKLIEKIGIEAVREKERLSRQATKEKKLAQPV